MSLKNTYEAYNERILVKVFKQEEKTKSGIILGYQQGQTELTRTLGCEYGEIQSIGKGVKDPDWKVGDIVHFEPCAAYPIEDNLSVLYERDLTFITADPRHFENREFA